jgi:hypothetical protein
LILRSYRECKEIQFVLLNQFWAVIKKVNQTIAVRALCLATTFSIIKGVKRRASESEALTEAKAEAIVEAEAGAVFPRRVVTQYLLT